MDNNTYQTLALRTKSAFFHQSNVMASSIVAGLAAVAEVAGSNGPLDQIKKALFYGRGKAVSADVALRGGFLDDPTQDEVDILHAMLGFITEAGEMAEALVAVLENPPARLADGLDLTNVDEEFGDGFWYGATYAAARSTTLGSLFKQNIAKLEARYPDKFFESDRAHIRDLGAERAALEAPVLTG